MNGYEEFIFAALRRMRALSVGPRIHLTRLALRAVTAKAAPQTSKAAAGKVDRKVPVEHSQAKIHRARL